MPTLFWTGKISLPLKIMMNMVAVIAWVTGNARNSSAMKDRMKDGYDGKYSNYIDKYDELASFHYEKISDILIQKIDCKGKEIIDVGCGTGILSFLALDKGASKLSCVDISKLMLEKCKRKSITKGYTSDLISFHEGDAERLPISDATCDVVFLNMVLGMVPNQQATIAELARILRPGGTIALSAHGPAHYREAIEANLKSMNMRYFFGHRFEFWPRDEKEIKTFFMNAGLGNIQTKRLTWIDKFENGGEAFDFLASTSGLWWYHRLPPEIRSKETEKSRTYFQRKNITQITSDVVFASGLKIDSHNKANSADSKSRADD
ncbi:MAG: class I SAM-dependent methyltransferase [Candidatus Cloacimonetes bacterium]|nr:class I SAM-dependent methyltransferase [Candidatus Cloacimonadota bacterium]